MTSEVDGSKTNEFLRRRKLRLQQVREQSKDIAKKIRQRAKVENLRQVIELESKKKKEYLQRQGKLIRKLEEYYAAGLENVGSSHKNASEVRLHGADGDKVDISKQRGRDAAAELRKKRQQILDKQKELLDRKLQAREAANEISRDKSGTAINRLLSKSSSTGVDQPQSKSSVGNSDNLGNAKKHSDVARSDMATQWDLDEIPNEWEPNIPTLLLPNDDNSVKESNNNNVDSKSDKSKKLDLFAVSEEMPSSLCGGMTKQEEKMPVKSSLTLVSEYLQNRDLRLRETDTNRTSRKTEDFQSLKQTILRTRTSKEVLGKGETIEKPFKSNKCIEDNTIPRKSSVTMYNHTTRDSRDIPFRDDGLVVRNNLDADDAYSQAMKESSASQPENKDHHKKVQEIRSKVAMTKQNIEKEYRDTISFLNALPKGKGNRPIKTAYMDDQRQQMQRDSRQQKLQQEFRKIEKESSKHSCKHKPPLKSRSPVKETIDVFENTDMQYSWMPVPESDGNLAVHTIPTTLREGKGNSVKFSKIDSYHEYRSRHKHTPPTKDTTDKLKQVNITDTSEIQDSSDSDSVSTSSSVKSVRAAKQVKPADKAELSDAERIIIYKILDTKTDAHKKTSKLMKNIAKSLTRIEQKTNTAENKRSEAKKSSNDNAENLVSFQQLDEGVYKTVNENGDNIASMYFNDNNAQVTDGKDVPKRCANCKKHSSRPHKVVPPQQWDSVDEVRERSRSTREVECNCYRIASSENKPEFSQPSMTTSTTSFLTAANDKSSNTASERGFIKLVDEVGRETGKFYIGASDLLKSDAYEVVIQLRKRSDEKESSDGKTDDNKDDVEAVNKMTVVSSTQTSLRDIQDSEKNNEAAVSDVSEKKESKAPETERDSYRSEAITDRGSRKTMSSDISQRWIENVLTNEPVESKVSEKKVSDVEEVNARHVTECDATPAPRPATSTYTQTSLDSPSHRPVLFHMSSSTSTAYMSPPEVIVPKFIRSGYQITDKNMQDARNYAVKEIITEQHEYSEELNCDCESCRRMTLNKHVHAPKLRCKSAQNPRTPPNTAGSGRSGLLDHMYFHEYSDNITTHARVNTNKKCKRGSHRCATHKLKHDEYFDLGHKRSRHSAPSTFSSQNLALRVPSCTSSKKSRISTKRSKASLKPMIKNYVDKLLELNKESLKAVQIVDQECSTVTTPSSSVINVPDNIDKKKCNLEYKLSLEKIRDILKQKLVDENENKYYTIDNDNNRSTQMCYRLQSSRNIKHSKMPRKKTALKVKSLNISRKWSRTQMPFHTETMQRKQMYSSSSTKEDCVKKQMWSAPSRSKLRSKSSPTPRLPPNSDTTDRSGNSDLPYTKYNIPKFKSKLSSNHFKPTHVNTRKSEVLKINESSNHVMTTTSNDSDMNPRSLKNNNTENPNEKYEMSISTQTSINVDSEVNYMKLAEDKLQNMEKIADLTEKCTKRLSNLAKVLEEVRKNKTLAYSHISSTDATSDSDQKSDKNVNKVPSLLEQTDDIGKNSDPHSMKKNTSIEDDNSSNSNSYVPFLSNIPKPVAFKSVNSDLVINSSSSSSRKSNSSSPVQENADQSSKHRAKPPPALSRIHLKRGQDFVVPHELSTVVEVDSPMSIKLKSSRNDTKVDAPDTSNNRSNGVRKDHRHSPLLETNMGEAHNPDLLDNNEVLREQHKNSTVQWSDNNSSKLQIIDIEQFNEIMLKPFFSLQEYAKQCNVGTLDDGSNLDDLLKNDHINDELSSLHSEASLPDVISELLKRNIISEPFKFDSGSNVNSTTVSSESTISVLALSRARQGPNKSSFFKNKENVAETSDTMSVSSNPDLENAFKKLGMGWASSTLKKTKERLALSSSSNSSSSLSQFKVKSYNHDIPEPVSDTISALSLPSKLQQRGAPDNSKNAEQQTSKTNAMTVKEFLTNKLAKKITFNKKSMNDTAEEYVSLYETNMPEEMKHSSLMIHEEKHSIDNSLRSGNNNRARTSTPVQLYKSMTYQSSSGSNLSNGLFSNVDDLSSVKVTSASMKHSTSDKDDLIIPNISLRMKKGSSDCSKSD